MKRQGEHSYLEDVLGEKAMSWVMEENRQTLDKLGDPAQKPLYHRILSILESKEKIPHVRKIGDFVYNFWQDSAHPRGVWRRCTLEQYQHGGDAAAATPWEVVLDVDALGAAEGESWVYKGATVCDDGSPLCENRVLLHLSRGGADATVVREFNLASKAFVPAASGGFVLPEAKSRVAWKDKDTLLVGTVVKDSAEEHEDDNASAAAAQAQAVARSVTASGYPRRVHEWKRGSVLHGGGGGAGGATLVFEGEASDVSVSGYVARHRGHALELRHRALTFYTSSKTARRLGGASGGTSGPGAGAGAGAEADGPWVVLDGLVPADASLSTFADFAVLQLKSPWAGHASGSLVAVPTGALLAAAHALNHPSRPPQTPPAEAAAEAAFRALPATVLFAPSERCSLASWTRTRNHLLLHTLDNVKSKVAFWRYHEGSNSRSSNSDSSDGGSSDGSGGGSASSSRFEWAGCEEEGAIRGASLRAVDADASDLVFFTHHGFTAPASLKLVDASEGPRGLLQAPPPPPPPPGSPAQRGHEAGASAGNAGQGKRADAADAANAPRGVKGAQVLRTLPRMFDATDVVVRQMSATSKDGTQVPYFVVGKPRADGGPAPTLLYGYGGFQISLLPSYAATIGAGWLERGGTYVVANLRGGGEFGPPWHQAALKEKRHKAYEDFEAVAEDLIATGITTTQQLACRGGSNGGLLVGNMLVRRPSLFGAMVCAVPLLDMRRYSKLLAGASWMAEYGDPEKPEEWAYLKHHSAYHHIDPAARYPPLLMTTSTRDDRVHPYHARAFVKRLQDVQAEKEKEKEEAVEQGRAAPQGTQMGGSGGLYYYENVEGGHGGAADAKQQAFMATLYLDFLEQTIGQNLASQGKDGNGGVGGGGLAK